MGWDEISNSVCPVARALALVGDRWTMLILMELVRGVHRFDALQAQTGMSSHLLSTRLKRMEQDGLIERRAYSERPPRYAYYATQKSRELDPVLMILRTWGRKWEGDCPDGQPATMLRDKASGAVIDELWQLPGGGKNFTFDQLDATPGPAFLAERANRQAAFVARISRSAVPASEPVTPAQKRAKAVVSAPIPVPAKVPVTKRAAKPVEMPAPAAKRAVKVTAKPAPTKAPATRKRRAA